jgi:hypothetical protein
MDYSSEILLTPHNYLEWKPKKILLLRCRGLYQIIMAMEVDFDFVNEKNDFLNRQYMAIGSIGMSVSPKIFHQVYEESQGLTPNELCTILEVLFGNKEYCEDFMQEVKQIEPKEKPSEDQASYYEESSIKVYVEISIPITEDDVYSISYLFSEIHVEDIWHASQDSHEDTVACTIHASHETKRDPRTLDAILILSETNLQKQIGYLNSSWENIQFQKKNYSKWSPESEFMIILKSTKFQHFSGNDRTVFKISSKIDLDIIHYKNIKWICVEISMMHILHQICADIYIFNKIFKEHKLAQLQGLLGVKDMVA